MADHKSDLRQALALMKAGQRDGAVHILRRILQADRENIEAWWLLAHAVNDKARKIQVLERMLRVAPDHPKAQALLEKLRAEVQRETQTAYQISADHPDFQMPQKPRKKPEPTRQGPTCRSFTIAGVVVFFFLCFGIGMINNTITNLMETLFPVNVDGPAPEQVVRIWFDASFSRDWATVQQYHCSIAYEDWVTYMSTEFAPEPNIDVSFDFSDMQIEEYSRSIRTLDMELTGSFTVTARGYGQTETLIQPLDALIVDDYGRDYLAIRLIVEDNRWVVCED